ncbi:MAG TPA: M20/M25/M40 family metallo-hydrolase [Gaiellales bacterium]|jgi:putative aminopeptidase FrvX|nr:M20/M25/M40 family metallo-hydrolase [Gaiellales bacterium]
MDATHEAVFRTLSDLVELHSPSGVEGAVDDYLLSHLADLGATRDAAGNIVLRVDGREPGPLRAVLAHKDEIGALVKRVGDRGELAVNKLGGSFPWVWGEGPVDVLGRHTAIPGVLSFGSRHITDESDHKRQQTEAGVRWRDAWVETKLTPEELAEAGVRAGSRVVPSAARKRPIRLGRDGEYVASYAIDDKASVAGLVELAARVKTPRHPVELVFTAREEIGCHGARWYATRSEAEAAVAFEVTPVAKEYRTDPGPDPVLVTADSHGPLEDTLSAELEDAAAAAGVTLRYAALSSFGSDATAALSSGLIARTACLAFATENTHGFEIAHLGGIVGCVDVLERWLAG